MSSADQDKPAKSEGVSQPERRTITVVRDRIDSGDLFVGNREITIGHGRDVYRLRLTSQNKLILTK
jgi:hemin uptake protein HemP